MAADKKNRIKRVVLSWLCVAALASGSLPGSFSGIIPAVTVAAEAPIPSDHVIDLAELVNYGNNTTTCPTGVSVANNSNVYSLWINQSGTYKLTGSNYINNSYVDIVIFAKSDVNATIICDDVYIKNDYGSCFPDSGGFSNSHNYFYPFRALGSMTLSGNVTVETYYCAADDYSAPVAQGNVTGTFFDVVYKDAEGNFLGKTSYLSGGTYSDTSGITNGKCVYTMDGMEKVPFDPTNITAAADVICTDHSFDANGVCTVCGAKYEIDLSKLPDYAASSDPILEGKVSVEVRTINGSPRYTVYISESGSYILKGSNFINGCYCDVEFFSRYSADVTLVCDDVYIRNDDGTHEADTSGNISHSFVLTPFGVGTGSLTLTGKLAVDTYCCREGDYTVSFKTNPVTADYFEVTYKDENNKVIGKTFYLKGSTYSDKSEVPSQYSCVTSNGAVFDYNNITAAATVICSDHDINENGVCNNCSQNFLIDLSKLSDYLSDPSALPDGVTIKNPDNFDDIVEITITKSGKYVLKGKNYCNGAYFDVKFIIADNADVTFECVDAFIKNDNVGCMINSEQYLPTFPEGVTVNDVYSYDDNMDYSGNYTAFNYVTPFNITNGAKLTLSGKLFVDTAHAVAEDGASFDLPVYEGGGNLATGLSNVYYCDSDNNNKRFDNNYCLYGTNYIATDYIDSKYHCVQVSINDPGDYSFNGSTEIYLALHHHIPDDSNTCTNCGQTFDTIYTVKIGDETKRVAAGDTVDPPADPAADVGKKFDGWYDENGNKFDFTKPVTKNVVLSAKFSDSPVKSVATVTPPTNSINYIEGNKFDPTGLKIEVTYDDGRSEEITYDPANTLFKFSPALETALTPADTKITVTYGEKAEDGSNTLDIPITVAAKQVTSVAIKSAPTKTSYIEGNSFDPTGLVITLTYDNGDTVDVAYNDAPNDFTFDKDVLALGDTTVQITYGGKSVKHEIIVAEKSVVSASIKTMPQKTSYKVGEDIDVTGGTLILTYDNNSTKEIPITAAMLTYDNTKAGKATVTVTYGAFKDTFEVEFEKVTVDPTDPPKPTEPIKPSKPTEPTEPTKPTTNEPQIKGNDGKMGWDAILGEIDDAKDGDTVTVDMNGTTKLPKDIVNDLMGKDIDLVLDMGNGIVWTINGLTITNPIDVDMGVTIGSGIPVKVINAVTGECSYITITLAHNGEFGFVPVLTIEMNEKDIGYYANLYYYNETENSTEFINSGLIGKDGKVNLAFTHASEYVIVIDDHDHGKAADGSSDSDTNPSTGVTMVFGAALVSSAAMIISRKRRK